MVIIGATGQDIAVKLNRLHPELPEVQGRVRARVPFSKREAYGYQAAALYHLAKPYNVAGANILEIGTAWGYTAAHLAEAAPLASIVTLNPKKIEVPAARAHLRLYQNVTVVPRMSWDYLADYAGPYLDFIFVDGDHGAVARDLPWWEWLLPGGCIVFHDYAPKGARNRPCPPVYNTLNAFTDALDRGFDVLIVDDGGAGLAGFYRGKDEPLPDLDLWGLVWHLDIPTHTWQPGAQP